ncbi:MAG: hypothetical protein Q8731_02155, partial [Candidatus Phytoplasma australasiaticum]|nr:hypothetical protein [Candidatus Phytoplasma australasiaticum]
PYLLGYSGMQPIYLIEKFVFLKPFLYLSKDKIINYANQKKFLFWKMKLIKMIIILEIEFVNL